MSKVYFEQLIDHSARWIASGERLIFKWASEQTGFSRINQAKIRQTGEVQQTYLTLILLQEAKEIQATLTLSHDLAVDLERIDRQVQKLRHHLVWMPDFPYSSHNPERSIKWIRHRW